MGEKVCSNCVFSEDADIRIGLVGCTVHNKIARGNDTCEYWAEEPDLGPEPELENEERFALQEEDLRYQQ